MLAFLPPDPDNGSSTGGFFFGRMQKGKQTTSFEAKELEYLEAVQWTLLTTQDVDGCVAQPTVKPNPARRPCMECRLDVESRMLAEPFFLRDRQPPGSHGGGVAETGGDSDDFCP